MLNKRILLVTENGRDLTEESKIKLLNKEFLELNQATVVTDPLLVFPKYLKRNLKSNDNVVVVYDDGSYKVFREAERLKKFLRGQTAATWKLLQSYKE